MKAQEILNATVEHMKGMKRRAVRDIEWDGEQITMCAYLTPDGSQCAIGFRIPKGHSALMETGGVRGLLAFYPDLERVLLPDDMNRDDGEVFLLELQRVHDDSDHWTAGSGFNELGWDAFRELAETHGLEVGQ